VLGEFLLRTAFGLDALLFQPLYFLLTLLERNPAHQLWCDRIGTANNAATDKENVRKNRLTSADYQRGSRGWRAAPR
jgi:hypothetical protein